MKITHLRGRDPRLRHPGVPQKIDVLPGGTRRTWYHPTKIGEYHIFCDQYCGTWHSLMVGKIVVVPQDEFDEWLPGTGRLQGTGNPVDGSLAQRGPATVPEAPVHQAATRRTRDGRRPRSWKSCTAAERAAARAAAAEIADDDVHPSSRSVNPRAKVVEGWEPIMPALRRDQVTAEELNALVAYIQ